MEQQNDRLRNTGFATFFFSGICAISAGVVVSLLVGTPAGRIRAEGDKLGLVRDRSYGKA